MKNQNYLLIAMVAVFALIGCKNAKKAETPTTTLSGLSYSAFKSEINGKEHNLYVMKNANGMEVCVINYGARIVSVLVPDKTGEMQDVVLAFDSISHFLNRKSDFGAAIGRYGNRIANGKFILDKVEYQLPLNNGTNSLHGGPIGFQYQFFDITQVDAATLECRYLSPDGDNGYPGNLNVKITYQLTDDNAIDIFYEAETDKPTVVNLTNHSYFNLSGNPANTVLDHVLFMNCDNYTPVDARLIPTGEIAKVKDTPMDFTQPKPIGESIDDYTFAQIKLGSGYDHNWIFTTPGDINTLGCKAYCPSTGITLEVYTTEPGVQLYTGNFVNGTGKKGIVYRRRSGLCLETQHYPDSPNHPNFPSTALRPGEKYTNRCIYKFGVE